MKCQSLYSVKNKKNISKRRLLKVLPRVQSVNSNAASVSSSQKYFEFEIKPTSACFIDFFPKSS